MAFVDFHQIEQMSFKLYQIEKFTTLMSSLFCGGTLVIQLKFLLTRDLISERRLKASKFSPYPVI